jgi:hypothetical protein
VEIVRVRRVGDQAVVLRQLTLHMGDVLRVDCPTQFHVRDEIQQKHRPDDLPQIPEREVKVFAELT